MYLIRVWRGSLKKKIVCTRFWNMLQHSNCVNLQSAHLQIHPDDKHPTDNEIKEGEKKWYPWFCITQPAVWGCQPVVWEVRPRPDPVEEPGGSKRVTEKNSTFPRHSSLSYTQSNTVIPSLFNWLPLATFWQRKHWLSATINHSLFVWWDAWNLQELHSVTADALEDKFDLNKNITSQLVPKETSGVPT